MKVLRATLIQWNKNDDLHNAHVVSGIGEKLLNVE